MKPAKKPVSDHTSASIASGVPTGSCEPTRKHVPVVMPPNAVIVLRTRKRSDNQPDRNTLHVNTIQKYDVIPAARAGSM
jgi:hypothetical protein